MDILLIRHGECLPTPESYNAEKHRRDPVLTARGEAQAARLARRLKDAPLGKIYASDLLRAVQTAEIINQVRPRPLEVDFRAELREIDMGRLAFSTWEDIAQEDADYVARWHSHTADLPYPDGECGEDVRLRAWPVMLEIARDWQQAEAVAVVAHGGVIRVLLCAALGIPQEKRFLFGAPLHNCGITTLRCDPGSQAFTVQTVNDAAHLAGE